jgi:Ca2+-binding EF-hand superfamily protein
MHASGHEDNSKISRAGRPGSCQKQSLHALERRILDIKKNFLEKNEAKTTSFQDIFRIADVHKTGSLGRDELMHAFEKIGSFTEPEVVDHLLSTRAKDQERLSFNDFMRFFDDRSGNMLLLKRAFGQPKGDFSNMTHLWLPTKPEVVGCKTYGTLNDVLVSTPFLLRGSSHSF